MKNQKNRQKKLVAIIAERQYWQYQQELVGRLFRDGERLKQHRQQLALEAQREREAEGRGLMRWLRRLF